MQSITRLLNNRVCFAVLLFSALPFSMSSCKKSSDSGPAPSQPVAYSGTFVKSADNVTTSATGTVSSSFNPDTRVLTYNIQWAGLTSEVVDMHFHDNGPVIIGIEGFATTTSGSISGGKATFTVDQVADLKAGKIYVQIHTANYPGGEIIATLTTGGSNPPSDPPSNPPPY